MSLCDNNVVFIILSSCYLLSHHEGEGEDTTPSISSSAGLLVVVVVVVMIVVRAAGVVAGAHRVAVVEGVGGVPVVLHILQPGVVIPVSRAPVGLRAAGEVGVL